MHTLTAVHSHEHPIDLNCFSAINLNLEDESDKEQTVRRRLLVELTSLLVELTYLPGGFVWGLLQDEELR